MTPVPHAPDLRERLTPDLIQRATDTADLETAIKPEDTYRTRWQQAFCDVLVSALAPLVEKSTTDKPTRTLMVEALQQRFGVSALAALPGEPETPLTTQQQEVKARQWRERNELARTCCVESPDGRWMCLKPVGHPGKHGDDRWPAARPDTEATPEPEQLRDDAETEGEQSDALR